MRKSCINKLILLLFFANFSKHALVFSKTIFLTKSHDILSEIFNFIYKSIIYRKVCMKVFLSMSWDFIKMTNYLKDFSFTVDILMTCKCVIKI